MTISTAIYDWIADRADTDTAFRYVLRIRNVCEELADFPNRGTRRPSRRLSFGAVRERRVTIAYLVQRDEVLIARILYAGRDLTREFGGS